MEFVTATFKRSCEMIEGHALRHIVISRAKLDQIVEQSRVLCEDYVYCRLQVTDTRHHIVYAQAVRVCSKVHVYTRFEMKSINV